MATSDQAYQINCMDEWSVFYRYWKDKPGCIAKVVEDLRAKGEIPSPEAIPSQDIAAASQDSASQDIAVEPERVTEPERVVRYV